MPYPLRRTALAIFALAALLAMLALVGRAQAATSITIVNAGFEATIHPDNGFSGGIPGWNAPGRTALQGDWNPNTPRYAGEAPEGQNIAYSAGGTISQVLSDTLAVGSYTLTVQVGDRLDSSPLPYSVELRAGGVLLASNSEPLINGQFVLVTVVYDALAGDPQLGELLEIRLVTSGPIGGATETDYDDVQLTAQGIASLSVSLEPAQASVDLTATGDLDWVSWSCVSHGLPVQRLRQPSRQAIH